MAYTNYYKKTATPTVANENGEVKNEVATTATTMSIETLLDSPAVKSLAQSLRLNNKQVAKANSAVLKLACDDKLKYCSAMSKVRFAYACATYDYANQNAIAPIAYEKNVQAQPQYQAYLEDMSACGGVEEINWVRLYKGQTYKTFINKNDNKEIRELPIIELDSPFDTPEVIGYYCYAKCKNGKTYTSLMSIEDCKKWATTYSISYRKFNAGEAKSAIWNDKFDDMAIKTVIKCVARKVLKDYPFDRLSKLIEIDQAVFTDKGVEYADNPQNAKTSLDVEGGDKINNRLTPEKEVVETDVKPVEEETQN